MVAPIRRWYRARKSVHAASASPVSRRARHGSTLAPIGGCDDQHGRGRTRLSTSRPSHASPAWTAKSEEDGPCLASDVDDVGYRPRCRCPGHGQGQNEVLPGWPESWQRLPRGPRHGIRFSPGRAVSMAKLSGWRPPIRRGGPPPTSPTPSSLSCRRRSCQSQPRARESPDSVTCGRTQVASGIAAGSVSHRARRRYPVLVAFESSKGPLEAGPPTLFGSAIARMEPSCNSRSPLRAVHCSSRPACARLPGASR